MQVWLNLPEKKPSEGFWDRCPESYKEVVRRNTFFFSFCLWTLSHEVVICGAVEPSCNDQRESLGI